MVGLASKRACRRSRPQPKLLSIDSRNASSQHYTATVGSRSQGYAGPLLFSRRTVSSIRVRYKWAMVWHRNETDRLEPHCEQYTVPIASSRPCIVLSMRIILWVER